MAPTIGEANAIFTVLRWMGLDRRDGFTPTDEQAADALVLLAQKAGKVLLVTADEQEVRAAFARLAAARRDDAKVSPGTDDHAAEEEPECSICVETIECENDCASYESDGRCCCSVRSHCCLCGGSPYCNCCPKCKQCIAQCGCPIAMKLQDGSEVIL